jgi:hypothetical protein
VEPGRPGGGEQVGIVGDHRAGIHAQRSGEMDGVSRAEASGQQWCRRQVTALDVDQGDDGQDDSFPSARSFIAAEVST